MTTTKIAIIREEKVPEDKRTPITPKQARALQEDNPSVEIICQSSEIRCYFDEEYRREGISVSEDISECDIFLGVKEVQMESLVAGKTYLFFSHTIKQQPYNQKLLQHISRKKITLIDYECLTDQNGMRVIAFGRWAGIVGAYNALWTYGQKYGMYNIKRAWQCLDLEELFSELKKISIPPVKLLLTGDGRVSRGAVEVLQAMGIKKVDPEQYLFQQFVEPVYSQIDVDVYTKRMDGEQFSFDHFFQNPELYKSNFRTFYKTTDVLIMAAYWDPKAPVLFELSEVKDSSFSIRTIADITCDINGSVPTTIQSTTIDDPAYDLNLDTLEVKKPFSDQKNMTVMSVDNLPNELPRDASESFGEQLLKYVMPDLLNNQRSTLIKNATILSNGELTPNFSYLKDYLMGT